MPRIPVAGWLLSCVAVGIGVLGMSAAWVAISVASGRSCSWLALLAAADMALMLRLVKTPSGAARVALAVAATLASVALSQWLIAATQLGFSMGLQPWASAMRLGPALGWSLVELSLTPVDLVLLGASLPLAAILAQRGRSE